MKQSIFNKFSIAGILKTLAAFVLLLPFTVFAQVTITGKILNSSDNKPIANVSVFLSNATIGDRTSADGSFTLQNVMPGKYNLVVSFLGFETYDKAITVGAAYMVLPDISLAAKAIALKEVAVKYRADPSRENYYYWFKDEFLGTSDIAKQCKILNPDLIDLVYDGATQTLNASSTDFLEIENNALGYKLKYLVTNFKLVNKDSDEKKIYYEGPVFFEEMKGSAAEERRWKKQRLEVYENSPMHFLRAALNDELDEAGFQVQQLAIYANPDRPAQKLIDYEINYYKELKSRTGAQKDSLSYWEKKSKLLVTLQKLLPYNLTKADFILSTDQAGQYALTCDFDGLYICYNKNHRYHTNSQMAYLNNANNTENTLISFNSANAPFYKNGVILNPYSVLYYGVWAKSRVAELLPIDYEPQQVPAQTDIAVKEYIVAKLDTFARRHMQEKAYLHFDKPYYAAGDTVYFKAYVTLGEEHQLSNLSGVLHAELISPDNKISQSIKLEITDGVAWGDFALPDTLSKGGYHVRAYTRWMKNDGEGSYFHQTIPVISLVNNKIPESGAFHKTVIDNNKPDVQFFPEGGGLVADITSKIAFKIVGPNGLGMEAKGVITDDKGEKVTEFATTHLGMGSFYLLPAKTKSYKAQIIYADGMHDLVDLPTTIAKGVTISINNDSVPNAAVKVMANNDWYQENRNKTMTLLVWSAGIVTTIPFVMDRPEISLNILKHPLHSGIAKVTLFSATGEPVCERLMFIQNYDQLRVAVNSDKTSYLKREKANVAINIKDWTGTAMQGHFSVSVTDESKVPVDEAAESTIMTNLLLTSDLKGYVEQPNYYFINTNSKTQSELDLVMLTNGYRRFEWKKVLNNEYPLVAYQPEKALEIAGTAKNASGKPLIKTMMTLAPANGGPLFRETTDSAGNFRFTNILFTDSARFFLSAMNDSGNSNLTYKESTADTTGLAANKFINDTSVNQPPVGYLQNRVKQHEEAIKYGLAKEIMLKEVKIKKNKHTLDDDYPSSKLGGAGNANQVIHSKDLSNLGRLSDQLQAAIPGIMFVQWPGTINRMIYLTVKFHTALANPPPMLIVVDGVKMDTDMTVDEINSNDVETIEVLKDENASIYGSLGGGGILAITTKRGGGDPGNNPSRGVLPITVAGFYKARKFYAPKYEHTQDAADKKDLRSTIYWAPELVTDKDGNVSFSYYNADGTGSYRVVVEGIDENGNLGRQVYRYKVE